MLLLPHVVSATSAASEAPAGLEHSRWFTPPSGPLAGLTRRLDSAGTCKNLSPSCYVSHLSYYMATQDPPKVQKGKLTHLFRAWAQHCHFCPILPVQHLLLHWSHMTRSCVPRLAYVRMFTECPFLLPDLQTRWNYFSCFTFKLLSRFLTLQGSRKTSCSKDFSPRKGYLSPTADDAN